MPNGIVTGTREEWDRLEAPLKALDADLAEFARRHCCETRANYHSWPRRELIWDKGDGLRRSIDIYLEDKDNLFFAVNGEASDGSEQAQLRGYFHARSVLFANLMPAPLNSQRMLQVLDRAYREVERLTAADLGRIEVKRHPTPSAKTLIGLAIKGYWDALGQYWRRASRS